MIIFQKLVYSNFLSTGSTPIEIDLSKSSATLVVGHNGAGKSTMLDALSFGLFGKAHRNINKNQLVNAINQKNTFVTVEFSVGPTQYLVKRGIKPNIFEIYKNGKLLNQESHSRDYQKILEQNILKLNHKSFHQVVVLGTSNFIPFMQLPTYLRRGVIEDLLDITIFSKMNALLKDKSLDIKNSIRDIENSLKVISEKISLQKSHIEKLTHLDIKRANAQQKKIADIESEIKLLENRNSNLQNEYDTSYYSIKKSRDDMTSRIDQMVKHQTKIENKASGVAKEAMFYEQNSHCPTCEQEIDDELKHRKIAIAKEKAKELNIGLSDLKKMLNDHQAKLAIINQDYEKMGNLQFDMRTNEAQIVLLRRNLSELNTDCAHSHLSITEAQALLGGMKDDKVKLSDNYISLMEMKSYHDAIGELLKDSGIKTKIIREYLPSMNSLINKYLNILDFFVKFELDENFNETIKSRHRDEFTYASFSEGEKQRIDLALLFAWRQIAKLKNSANTNLLILDETFDSSMDSDGVDNLLKILYSMRGDSNIFIISHKHDLLDGKFPDKIEFEKRGNFTFRK